MISPQSLGEYIANSERDKGGWPQCCTSVCSYENEWDTETEMCVLMEHERGRLGWFCYASGSQYACRLEVCGSSGWLSPLSLPVKALAKRNVFFTGFGCQMLGMMDSNAGWEDGEVGAVANTY